MTVYTVNVNVELEAKNEEEAKDTVLEKLDELISEGMFVTVEYVKEIS